MKRKLWLLVFLAPVAYSVWVFWLSSQGLLPEVLATHWGASGKADGFASVSEHLIWSNIALVLGSTMVAVSGLLPKIHPAMRRLLLGVTIYFALFMQGLMIYVIAAQIGLSDASSVRLGLEILWFVLPVLLLTPMMLSMPKVSLSDKLRIQLWGVTFLGLEYQEISRVTASEVKPSQFGGLGIRFAKGKVAFIPSKGPAIEITSKQGEVILVRSNQVENLIAAITPKI
ncbi:MAG: hypothetical protein RL028_675 [Actinomycetota bacterium]|jgi:hypothetical protein